MRPTTRTLRAAAGLGAAALVTATLTVPAVASAQAEGSAGGEVVTSGTCPREEPLVRRALERSALRVDVEGDRRLDTVAVVTDFGAPRRCRAFVGVKVRGGAAYSAPLYRTAVPRRPFRAEIIGLPDLGNERGAEIVVDTHARADSALAQMFTLTRSGLRRVPLPAFEDGTFVVEGGGVTYPRGAGCTRAGGLLLSMATATHHGRRYQVTRQRYPVRADRLRLLGPAVVTDTVAAGRLTDRFWEFASPHWSRCTGTVRR